MHTRLRASRVRPRRDFAVICLGSGVRVRRIQRTTFAAATGSSRSAGIDELFGPTVAIAQLGYAPGGGTGEITLEGAPNPVADELRLPNPARVCHIKRVRLANDRRVILCDDYLPADVLVERGIHVEEV